ncbi:GTPase HflX [Acidithiobacillus sp. CV18-2]|uniref:GTPase HflX n=1 Tax=Igneacidithiobacillus copahuensis TaxID=2724909 RepID=A0AAE2YQT7_9PROT|nr:GTPase HflX [Acidithiobacillus sp. CV18-3]MBU2757389.1 GTPase HflX [Acidithiobacillus sp. BN09-2]MBU2776032.1 GTPase HflX [Acidithiobacillus sp. CV18-2]MBU2788545.1 GTPase HflX [Igneacidithiobacillus copahuensis]MBU2795923.1 GTPase HflX [Acidithiobacillus sp. VAN18-2]MBU2800291.1 GTPase HflX [Acidithiobacillus sp. VAN18-4]UTV82338.1 GTPase HflX [Acidithiobacillus sp. YTS05]
MQRSHRDRCLLIHIHTPGSTADDGGEEFQQLAADTGAEILGLWTVSRARLDPATCVGSGKVQEIADFVRANAVDLILFDRPLSPIQERNLERSCAARVIDRVGLILDIFARRARTHEGQLQVELAQLDHLRTRLVRGWTHLERQRGGIGLRGPGETQLETDRRLIGVRIRILRERLARVAAQRATQRRARLRAPAPTVALVGYTNAGKSSLFNVLTANDQYAADQLFATLDPAIRRLSGNGPTTLIADTVGFLRDLPTELIAAFRATLEEVGQAQLLLHVIDAAAPDRDAQILAVENVLAEIGAAGVPRLRVFNKIDLLGEEVRERVDETGQVSDLWLSAHSGAGVARLAEIITQRLHGARLRLRCTLRPEAGALRARLFREAAVLEERFDSEGSNHLLIEIDQQTWTGLQAEIGAESCQREDLPSTMRP